MSIRIISSGSTDGRSADVAVKRPQLLVQVGERGSDEDIHPPQQVVLRNHIVEIELIEQLTLISVLSPHHPRFLLLTSISRNQCSQRRSSTFSTASTPSGLRDAASKHQALT